MRKTAVLCAAAFAALLCLAHAASGVSIIAAEVAGAAKAGDFGTADQLLRQYRAQHGEDAGYLEALSWVGRGRLFAKQYQAALDNAALVRESAAKMLTRRKLDAEPSLPEGLGAAIEVTGQSLAALGRRDEAVTFLRGEAEKYRGASVAARIQKNINLLSLEGKPAPALDVAQWVAGPKPRPIAAHAGHPVLLFFWAHWCADCKQETGVIQQLISANKNRGLEVIAPTQRYGYVAGGIDAAPAAETPYIAQIFSIYYAGLGNVETPLSEANFVRYGVSTTPTLVMLNGSGVVTLYHPGLMTLPELTAALRR